MDAARKINADADWNWERCYGRDNPGAGAPMNKSAPCYNQFELKMGGGCRCDPLENHTAICAKLGGTTCSLGQEFSDNRVLLCCCVVVLLLCCCCVVVLLYSPRTKQPHVSLVPQCRRSARFVVVENVHIHIRIHIFILTSRMLLF